jgi:hypothetical protein
MTLPDALQSLKKHWDFVVAVVFLIAATGMVLADFHNIWVTWKSMQASEEVMQTITPFDTGLTQDGVG